MWTKLRHADKRPGPLRGTRSLRFGFFRMKRGSCTCRVLSCPPGSDKCGTNFKNKCCFHGGERHGVCVTVDCTPRRHSLSRAALCFLEWSRHRGGRCSDTASWGHSEAGPPHPLWPVGVPSTELYSWSSQPRTVGDIRPVVQTRPLGTAGIGWPQHPLRKQEH